MLRFSLACLLLTVGAVLALPSPGQASRKPSWWPDKLPWPLQHPESIQHPDSIQWPLQKPSWWPENRPRPPQRPGTNALQTSKGSKISHPEWIPWPPTHPEWIPWPPAGWFPENAPEWWPEGWEWPPSNPSHPEWIPWPPAHPEWIPWPPTHPEAIPWPPAGWFPEDAPEWWPEGWEWPPAHPDWIQWPPQHPEWIPWPPQHPEWIPTNPEDLPYIPSRDNRFHLFTRANLFISQPIVYQNANLLASTNFVSTKRTIVLVHDLGGSATSQFNAILVPALLAAGDVNVIIVDWSAGANSATALSTLYSVFSGGFVSQFISWVVEESNSDLANFHLVGLGIGGLNVGFIGRLLGSKVGYITALDPSRGPSITSLLPPLNPNVGLYTEVIHTDADGYGYAQPLGDVDFYPNGGVNMPGCSSDSACNRLRAVYFFAESVQSGGFTGVSCRSYEDALESNCYGPETLMMGGLEPKTGSSGIFYLRTNAYPPFSQE